MKLTLEWNLPDMLDTYLEALNRCFPGWGGEARYDWCFRRSAGAGPADMMVLRNEATLVAGSGVIYRTLETPAGRRCRVGIMGGSWTFAEARGQGCFTRIIQASIEACVRREAALLLAFVTESNPSYRRLSAAGSGLVPAWYVMSTSSTPPLTGSVLLGAGAGTVVAKAQSVRFVYPEALHWHEQLLRRPWPTEVLSGAGGWAVMGEAGESDRIEYLSSTSMLGSLLARAQAREHQLFLYTTEPPVRDAAAALGLDTVPGYLTVLAGHVGRLEEVLGQSWSSSDSKPLADPHHACYLGRWALQAGDRM